MKRSAFMALAGIALSLQLTGCGLTGTMASQPSDMNNVLNPYAVQDTTTDGSMMGGGMKGKRHGMGFFPGFNHLQPALSEDQKIKLKGIAQQGNPQPEQMKAHAAELKTLLLVENVDAAALKAFADARKQERLVKQSEHLERMVAARGILTDEQRNNLVAQLGQAPEKHAGMPFGGPGMMFERVLSGLNLTAVQQQAVDALQAKMKAQSESPARDEMRQAFIGFIKTGDKTALTERMANAGDRLPLDELIQVATALDLSQRTTLAKKLESFGQGMHAHHGPMGRFGH